MKIRKIGLIKGRHPLPVEGYMIQGDVSPENMTKEGILSLCNFSCLVGQERIDLYITGLSIATVAVMEVLSIAGITVEVWGYNPQTGKYYSQGVFCPRDWKDRDGENYSVLDRLTKSENIWFSGTQDRAYEALSNFKEVWANWEKEKPRASVKKSTVGDNTAYYATKYDD